MKIQDKPALLLVDIQKGLDDFEYYGGNRNNLDAEQKMRQLLDFWREEELPIFHIKHNSTNPNSRLRPNQIGNEIKDIVKPIGNEPVIEKNVNSGFIGTDLKERLESQNIQKVVIVGLTTDHCISTTTRMAGNLGFDTFLISDATATFDKMGTNGEKYPAELVHQVELAALHEEFATVLEAQELLDLLRFKTIHFYKTK